MKGSPAGAGGGALRISRLYAPANRGRRPPVRRCRVRERSAGDGKMLVHAATPVDRDRGGARKLVQTLEEPLRDGGESTCAFRAGRRFDDRGSGVSPFPNRDFERDLTEQGCLRVLRRLYAAALAEDLVTLLTTVTEEEAFIFDDAQNGDADLRRHREALVHVLERHLLRRRDDDRATRTDPLGQRERDVARPRRQIQDEIVEVPPVHALQELQKGSLQHPPAPHHRPLLLLVPTP